MTKLRYSSGGGAAVRQPCAVCTGAAHECSTEPLERLPVLGGRHTHNDERNPTGTALAGDKLGADYRLYVESSRQHAPGGQYRRRVGSGADGGATCETQTYRAESCLQWWLRKCCKPKAIRSLHRRHYERTNDMARRARSHLYRYNWFWPTHAHREQVHGCVYVPAHRLMLSKGVAA